mmetsp:Transcript_7089/g.20508  ORF Transcript_7089/g.20508 Transcript_7089/m.20508 type:complete len:290 (+) Transcript_7089:244-1113(+)
MEGLVVPLSILDALVGIVIVVIPVVVVVARTLFFISLRVRVLKGSELFAKAVDIVLHRHRAHASAQALGSVLEAESRVLVVEGASCLGRVRADAGRVVLVVVLAVEAGCAHALRSRSGKAVAGHMVRSAEAIVVSRNGSAHGLHGEAIAFPHGGRHHLGAHLVLELVRRFRARPVVEGPGESNVGRVPDHVVGVPPHVQCPVGVAWRDVGTATACGLPIRVLGAGASAAVDIAVPGAFHHIPQGMNTTQELHSPVANGVHRQRLQGERVRGNCAIKKLDQDVPIAHCLG